MGSPPASAPPRGAPALPWGSQATSAPHCRQINPLSYSPPRTLYPMWHLPGVGVPSALCHRRPTAVHLPPPPRYILGAPLPPNPSAETTGREWKRDGDSRAPSPSPTPSPASHQPHETQAGKSVEGKQ
ncbi:hypothetical protein KIL84_006968 [Mauremys mutica]|uniref:Uncharacterized protein n=1 Tax=Mauremys mutica TaxID=74926 RepID=A0A9D3X2I1_9SAUR|nr:hypothetical protein KIL84_006968 [Mauremys mutica]